MTERNIETTIHGRYLVEAPGVGMPLLVGFHGYAESAEIHFERLRALEGAGRWTVVSVQGLHRFYRGRSNDVVASWMTRQDRELAIAENNAYAARVIEAVSREFGAQNQALLLTGFSQGVAMAFRCATSLSQPVSGVIALGGDVPPELDATALSRIPAALIGRGTRDEWYSAEKMAADEDRLRKAGVKVQTITFDGAHEWSAEFSQAAARFLGNSGSGP